MIHLTLASSVLLTSVISLASTISGNQLKLKSIDANLSLELHKTIEESGLIVDDTTRGMFIASQATLATIEPVCKTLSEQFSKKPDMTYIDPITKAIFAEIETKVNDCKEDMKAIREFWSLPIQRPEASFVQGPNKELPKYKINDKAALIDVRQESSKILIEDFLKTLTLPEIRVQIQMKYDLAMGMKPVITILHQVRESGSDKGEVRLFKFQASCHETIIPNKIPIIGLEFGVAEKLLTCQLPKNRGQIIFQIQK